MGRAAGDRGDDRRTKRVGAALITGLPQVLLGRWVGPRRPSTPPIVAGGRSFETAITTSMHLPRPSPHSLSAIFAPPRSAGRVHRAGLLAYAGRAEVCLAVRRRDYIAVWPCAWRAHDHIEAMPLHLALTVVTMLAVLGFAQAAAQTRPPTVRPPLQSYDQTF